MNWEKCGRNRLWCVARHYPSILFEKLSISMLCILPPNWQIQRTHFMTSGVFGCYVWQPTCAGKLHVNRNGTQKCIILCPRVVIIWECVPLTSLDRHRSILWPFSWLKKVCTRISKRTVPSFFKRNSKLMLSYVSGWHTTQVDAKLFLTCLAIVKTSKANWCTVTLDGSPRHGLTSHHNQTVHP